MRASRAGAIALALAIALPLALSAARLVGEPVPGWALAAALAGLVATLAVGVFRIDSGVFARPILAGPRSRPEVAITFDDGPHPVHTRAILDRLEQGGHRGTFFVIGARAERHLDLIAEIARRGHGLGNHSYHHSRLTPLRRAGRLTVELERAGALLSGATGGRPRWFRPPIGLLSPPVVAAARAAGVELVGWSATARDGVAGVTVERALARLVAHLAPGAILVLHDAAERDDRPPIADAVLARLLDALNARGLRSVPLDELLR